MTQSPVCLAILRNPGGWRVNSEGGWAGDHAYRVDAEEAALPFAAASSGTGRDFELLPQRPGVDQGPSPQAGSV